MARSYALDELLKLRESPLVRKPSSLPPVEEWMGYVYLRRQQNGSLILIPYPDLSLNRVKSKIRIRTRGGQPTEVLLTTVSLETTPQIVDLCLRQNPDQRMVRIAIRMVFCVQANLMISQSPKTLSSDLPKQLLLLPLAQEATTKFQVLHNDQALTITTIQLSKMIVRQPETDTRKMDRDLKETGRNVTQN